MSLKSAWSRIASFIGAPQAPGEIEHHLHFLQDPFGDAGHGEVAEQAADFLLAHADEAHPRLLHLLETNRSSNPPALIEILPRFGRPESIPLLEKIVAEGLDSISAMAAAALARHPANEASQALERGLGREKPETVKASADGLASRGDRAACPRLRQHLDHPHPEARYHLIQAAARLDCLASGQLAAIAETDIDADIRNLAQREFKRKNAGDVSEQN